MCHLKYKFLFDDFRLYHIQTNWKKVMTAVDVKDPNGKVVFKVIDYDGVRVPAGIVRDPKTHFHELNQLTFKESDIFVVSFPKSGKYFVG